MTRPLYERDIDRLGERDVLAQLQPRWLFDHAHKLPISYGIDYALTRGLEVAAFAEIKCRPNLPFDYGDGYYLALQKVMRASSISTVTGRCCFLIVRLSCGGVWWCDMETGQRRPRLVWHGRSDRNNPNDYEACVVYP